MAFINSFQNQILKTQEEARVQMIYESVQEQDYSIARGAEKLGITVDELVDAMVSAGYIIPVTQPL